MCSSCGSGVRTRESESVISKEKTSASSSETRNNSNNNNNNNTHDRENQPTPEELLNKMQVALTGGDGNGNGAMSATISKQAESVDFNDFFSLRRPKDAAEALNSGLKPPGKASWLERRR